MRTVCYFGKPDFGLHKLDSNSVGPAMDISTSAGEKDALLYKSAVVKTWRTNSEAPASWRASGSQHYRSNFALLLIYLVVNTLEIIKFSKFSNTTIKVHTTLYKTKLHTFTDTQHQYGKTNAESMAAYPFFALLTKLMFYIWPLWPL